MKKELKGWGFEDLTGERTLYTVALYTVVQYRFCQASELGDWLLVFAFTFYLYSLS